MNKLLNLLNDYQGINIEENGITFTKDAFTQLYESAMSASLDHAEEMMTATGKGILIGAIGVGLVGLGVKGFKSLRKRVLEQVEEMENEDTTFEKIKMLKPEVMEVDDEGRVFVRVSKKDKETLEAIIAEVNENEKKH